MTIPLTINSLLFDLDGTLTVKHPSSLDVLFTILDEHKIPLMASAHRTASQFIYQYWAKSDQVAQDLEMYGEFTDEFWVHYLKRKLWAAGLTELQATDLALVLHPELEERHQPVKLVPEDVKPTLKTLRGQGYIMGMVSNRSTSIEEEMDRLGFLPYFDFWFTAAEVNSWKPDPGIFEHALYLAGNSPEATAYIGDNYYTDVLGAQGVGIYPILYDPRNVFPDADCQVITSIGNLVAQI
jgi:putative hydrolase of the HAD superfamily